MRVYMDTSVFGGIEDEIFSGASISFFNLVKKGLFQLTVSTIVEEELLLAPEPIRFFLGRCLIMRNYWSQTLM